MYAYVLLLKSGDIPAVVELPVNPLQYRTPYEMAEVLLKTKYTQLVRPQGLLGKYGFLVNDTGVIDELPLNYYGSALYGTDSHRMPISGDAVVVRFGPKGRDIDWIRKSQLPEAKAMIYAAGSRFHAKMEALRSTLNLRQAAGLVPEKGD